MYRDRLTTALGGVVGIFIILAVVWPGWLWGHPLWGPWGITPPAGQPGGSATAVPSKPGAPGGAQPPAATGDYVACLSPEQASAVYGPKVRAIGTPLWLNPGADRDNADICVFEFNANLSSGKVYDSVNIPVGTIATLNTEDNLVRVYKGPHPAVRASAATIRMIDNPNGGQIYGASHRFRNECTVLSNEVNFTSKEKAAGGFTSTHGEGNFTCAGIQLGPRATTSNGSSSGSAPAPAANPPAQAPAAASALSADQLKAQILPNETERSKVTCTVSPGNVKCITGDGTKVTWKHPGMSAQADYWGKFPAPTNASGCDVQVTSDQEKRSVVCKDAGATFTADTVTWTLPRPTV